MRHTSAHALTPLTLVAMRRIARDHSIGYRCAFCGLPQFGAAQMKKSPVHRVLYLGMYTLPI